MEMALHELLMHCGRKRGLRSGLDGSRFPTQVQRHFGVLVCRSALVLEHQCGNHASEEPLTVSAPRHFHLQGCLQPVYQTSSYDLLGCSTRWTPRDQLERVAFSAGFCAQWGV